MQYFTPKLHVQSNSRDKRVADRAAAKWKEANQRYIRHYKKIARQLPPDLSKFADEQFLHDADFDGPNMIRPFALPWSPQFVTIAVRQIHTLAAEFKNTCAVLFYEVAEPPVIETPIVHWVFHPAGPQWLWDEVDLIKPDLFSHEILVSDDRVIKIRFRDFHYNIVPLKQEKSAAAKPKKPARRKASA